MMYTRGDFISRHKSQDNDSSSNSGTVRSAKDDQHAYDNMCRAEVLYSNSSTSSSVDAHYCELYDDREPVYSNSQADAVTNPSSSLNSLQAGSTQQFSKVKSQDSSNLEVPPGVQSTKTQSGSLQDVEAFISSADAKLNKLTGMASRPPDVVNHTVSDSQRTAKASRKSWMRIMSSNSGPGPDAAAQIADEFKKTRQLSQSSDTGPTVTVQKTDGLKTIQKLMSGRISRLEPQQAPSTATVQSPHEEPEPIYDSLIPYQKSATTVRRISSSSSSSIAASSSYNLSAASTSHDASALDTTNRATSLDAGLRQLPSICSEFAGESECEWEQCPHLHVCSSWLAGQCPVLRRCPRPHSLRTAHNMTVLRDSGWRQDERDEVRRWLRFQASCDRLEAARLPPICLDHARGLCRAQPCDALHMCQRFLTGFCQKKGCTLGHDLVGDENNRRVLMMSGNEDVPAKKLLNKMAACMVPGPRLL